MTAYERFRSLELDRARLGLERGEERGGYFCTPAGARVIGWAGVDGVHYCFVEGFGETVFAVSPANLPGDYVHPLAGSFEEFIRLVLACGGTDAAEQAHGWSREQFEAYLAQNLPGLERRAALDALGVVGGASGPCAAALPGGEGARRQAACSALRFRPGEPVEWRLVFYRRTAEDMEVKINL